MGIWRDRFGRLNRIYGRVMGRVCLEKFCVLGNTRTKVEILVFFCWERERKREIYIFILFLNWFVFDTFKQVCWYSTILHMNFCYDIVVWSLFRMMLTNFFINFLLVIFISIIDISWNTVIFCFHLLIFFYLLCWKFLSKFYNNRHLISCLNYCIFTFFTTVK